MYLHGFCDLSKLYLGRVIWLIAALVTLSMTSYLVYSNVEEFFEEPIQIKLNRSDPENVLYPAMKFCFLHWVSWVNWTKVQELNFTKHELLYAMSYLSDIHSMEIFDIEEVENTAKEKLRHNNMTLKQFYIAIAIRKKVFYNLDNYNYSVELMPLNSPNIQNIFDLDHTICYLFTENEVANLIKEAYQHGSNQSLEKGYELKIDKKSLRIFEFENKNYITEKEMKIFLNSSITMPIDWMVHYPVFFYPDVSNPSAVYLDDRPVQGVDISISVYLKKNLPKKGHIQKCKEGQKSVILNFTFVEECLEKTREFIFNENNAYEDWIGYFNDIRPKKIFFVDENETVIENITFTRHHKLENWFNSSEKIKQAYEKMTNFQLFNSNLENPGCELWDINYKQAELEQWDAPLVPVTYPLARQIVVREEIIVLTLSNFIAKVGGVLGIWTAASVITIFQIIHLLFGWKKQSQLPKPDPEIELKDKILEF